jgi:hypothetical protein
MATVVLTFEPHRGDLAQLPGSRGQTHSRPRVARMRSWHDVRATREGDLQRLAPPPIHMTELAPPP